ncbi:DUF397 domain-containing protein [Streptomyces cyaneofuscatus]|uniref:DUF397 domain-containing protein n=1 Tax=Streptomyces TaxID=1883 RepID=UPI000978E6EB|nr:MULTISPECIES: DUF397 domain-containing protein [unclassified Streptomyces]ONI51208.1 hypothetical protein STIB_42490 [Streptomyces sp. IB2014 011-1]RDV49474.1 DUF397 domain-containing protein [Streptomyces sp. IB2014 011-12]
MTHSPDLSTASWRSSSYSNTNGGECVQVSDDFPGLVPVRDSKNPTGPALIVRATAWDAFVSSVK